MDDSRLPAIRPLKFWTEYTNDPAKPGEKKAVEWVRWVKVGESLGSTTGEKIARLRGNPEKGTPPAVEWAVLEPFYEAWKKNEEPPENGTPLAAWPGATPALVDALKGFGIRTVEEFRDMPDHEVSKIRLPNVRHSWATAGNFLKAQKDQSLVEAELSERDARIEALERQIAALAEGKKRGRPRKDEAA